MSLNKNKLQDHVDTHGEVTCTWEVMSNLPGGVYTGPW